MAIVRLNSNLRNLIVGNALEKSGVRKEIEDNKNKYYSFAARVYQEAISSVESAATIIDEFKFSHKKMREVGFKVGDYDRFTTSNICAAFGGERVWLSFGPDDNGRPHEVLDIHREKLLFSASHELSIEFRNLEKEKSELQDKLSSISESVKTAVNSVATVKRLLEIWPEAKELLPETMDDSKPSFPAISVESLNAIVGLPSGK